LVEIGRPAEGIAEYREVLRHQPNYPPAVQGLARAQQKASGEKR